MTSLLTLLWGPYNHQALDRWLQSELEGLQQIKFGPFGADLIYRPDKQDVSLLDALELNPPDALILVEPHLRLIGPHVFKAPCPIIVCSSFYPFSAQQWALFDGLIPLAWQPGPNIRDLLPVSQTFSISPQSDLKSSLVPQIEALLPALKARAQKRFKHPASLMKIKSFWQIAPVQFEALNLLQDDWLTAAYHVHETLPTRPPQNHEQKLSASQVFSATGQMEKARELILPLLQQCNRMPSHSFPVSKLADQCTNQLEIWQLSVYKTWLSTRPDDLSPLLNLNPPPESFETVLNHYLPLLERSPQPDIASWLQKYWPKSVEINLYALQLMPISQRQQRVSAVFDLLNKSHLPIVQKNRLLLDLLEQCPSTDRHKRLIVWQGGQNNKSEVNRFYQSAQAYFKNTEHDHLWLDSKLTSQDSQQLSDRLRQPDLIIHYPSSLEQVKAIGPSASKQIAFLPWNYGAVPRPYIDAAQHLDQIWLSSQSEMDAYLHSGISRECLHLIPAGVDRSVFRPEGQSFPLNTAKSFRFLFVGPCNLASGIDLLLQVFTQSFGPTDDVCLLIKTSDVPELNTGRPFETRNQNYFLNRIKELAKNPQQAEIHLIEKELSPSELAALYRSCNVLLQPDRSQSITTNALQAMACAKAVILPDHTAATEYCLPDMSWQIPSTTRFMARIPNTELYRLEHDTELPSFYYEPSLKSLSELLKLAAQHPDACQQKGLAAYQAAQKYDFKRVFQMIETQLQSVWNAVNSDPIKAIPAYKGLLPDSGFFRPSVLPQFNSDAYFGVLMIARWTPFNWRSLIRALKKLSSLRLLIPLKLTFIPLDVSCELAEAELKHEFEGLKWQPEFEILVLEPPTNELAIRELYQAQSCFVDLDPHAEGHWHVLAQLMGVHCLSSGQFGFLKSPLSQVCRSSSPDEIAWRLSTVLNLQYQTVANALAIREHIVAQLKIEVVNAELIVS